MDGNTTRREALALGILGLGATLPVAANSALAPIPDARPLSGRQVWQRRIEGQRRGDLGNETFLNPVLAGDNPDPSCLKYGDVYYKVSSSVDYYPGLLIWQSQDLVNWPPCCVT